MTKAVLIDLTRCVDCFACVIGCKDEHVDNEWLPYSKMEPVTGSNWVKVNTIERGKIPKLKINNVVILCQHCENPPCQKAATGGAVYTRTDGIVIIDPIKSVGQKQLVGACPYGAVYWNSDLNIPQKCTLCAHLIDNNETPRCARVCPSDAITIGEYSDLQSAIASKKAVTLHPEYQTKPRVFYVGLPVRFVAGALVNQKTDEGVAGAQVTAQELVSGKTTTITSDSFGDFWFEGLDPNKMYRITITKSGYVSKTMLAFTGTDKDLGDIALVGA